MKTAQVVMVAIESDDEVFGTKLFEYLHDTYDFGKTRVVIEVLDFEVDDKYFDEDYVD